ncbi:MAG: MFS transporter [Tsuneonella suprasediminis]|nr:MFS transporter [Altererythrobacter sp. N1]
MPPNPDSSHAHKGLLAPGKTLAPFGYPAFRAIWIANLVSNLGSMIQSVAAAWLMTDLTNSHVLIALVQASTTLPIMAFGVFAGAIADNFDRRRVMLAAQSGMLLISTALALVSWAGMIGPWSLLLFTLLVGIGTALNSPAWQASVRAQVGKRDLPQAISLNSVAFNLARSVGPALGGVLISLWSTSLAFALNALSYTLLIVVLLRWRPQISPPRRIPMMASIAIGLRFCAGSGSVRRILIRGFCLGVGFAGYAALLPVIVRNRLHGSEIDYGLMLGGFGIASILAALFVSNLRRRIGSEAVVGIGTIAFIIGYLILMQAGNMPAAIPAAFAAGSGWVLALTTINVAMQVRAPEEILGRCMSIYQATTFGGMALGAWGWGTLSDYTTIPLTLAAAGAWLTLSLVLLRLLAPMPMKGEGIAED